MRRGKGKEGREGRERKTRERKRKERKKREVRRREEGKQKKGAMNTYSGITMTCWHSIGKVPTVTGRDIVWSNEAKQYISYHIPVSNFFW